MEVVKTTTAPTEGQAVVAGMVRPLLALGRAARDTLVMQEEAVAPTLVLLLTDTTPAAVAVLQVQVVDLV